MTEEDDCLEQELSKLDELHRRLEQNQQALLDGSPLAKKQSPTKKESVQTNVKGENGENHRPAPLQLMLTPELLRERISQVPLNVPYGEYCRRTLDLDVSVMSGKLCSCCASLYVFRNDPSMLQLLMQRWYEEEKAVHILGLSSPTAGCLTDFEEFSNFTIGVFQQCVETYFNTNWDNNPKIVQINKDFKAYVETLVDDCLASGTACKVGDQVCQRNLHQERWEKIDPLEWVKASNMAEIKKNHVETGFVLIFHGLFSEVSCEVLEMFVQMKKVGSPIPHPSNQVEKYEVKPEQVPFIGVVNCAEELEMVKQYNIHSFPTLLFVDGEELRYYPDDGVHQVPVLSEWVLSKGVKSQKKRLKALMQKVRGLTAKQKFATARNLHSAIVMLHQLQPGDESFEDQRTQDDPPTFILLGGGMAAGKTTAVTELTRSEWWKRRGHDVVVVDADEFKQNDPLFLSNSTDLHLRSVQSAELLLIKALNTGRDIVFDGTMSWLPYVQQTIAMVRKAGKKLFAIGPGFKPKEGIEEYWVETEDRTSPLPAPYRIKFIGVFVHPAAGVSRAILRQLSTGRSVPVRAQLRSYKLFATNFEKYTDLCDEGILYNNNVWVDLQKGQSPVTCAEKKVGGKLEVVDREGFEQFTLQKSLNYDAKCKEQLWDTDTPTEFVYGASPKGPK